MGKIWVALGAGAIFTISAAGGCGGKRAELVPPTYEDDPAARTSQVATALEGHRAGFVLTWKGQRIGEAREVLVAAPEAAGGFRFERVERVVVRRGDAVSIARTHITVECDVSLGARRVVVERESAGMHTRAEATRMPDGSWRIVSGDAPARLADADAVPSTLVPLLVAAGGAHGRAFEGKVLVEGAGLAQARLSVDVEGTVARARYATAAGELRAEARLDESGRVAEAGLGAALGSRRADDDELARAFDPPEIVESSALVVAGSPRGRAGDEALRVTVSGVKVPPPALVEIPEQTVVMAPGGTWDVIVAPSAWPERGTGAWREVEERTAWVARALVDDLRFAAMTPDEALAAGRGDCTAHAVVLEADLRARGYDTRLVTGFVLDAGSLTRHRWVAVRMGKRWVPVDPMFDEVPARPTHLALAVHGASPDELAFIDDVVFAGWSEAIAAYAP